VATYVLYVTLPFGTSGVRALPLAAGINVGRHYFFDIFFSFFCQAQPSPSLAQLG
jgi:hypothetical protein